MKKTNKIIKWQNLYDSIDKDVEYDAEDLEILEEMKTSEYISLKDEDPELFEKQKKLFEKATRDYKKSKKIISIRLATHDISKIKTMAEEEWMPYQTLISAIIHKVANWKIELNFKE